jgi:hypothetical protein
MMARLMKNSALFSIALICVTLAVGCNEKDKGPKREDHERAHKPRYHPHVHNRSVQPQGASTAQSFDNQQLSPSEEAELSGYVVSEAGPVGTPVLFVNGEPITVQEVLEPIYIELSEKARDLDVRQYQRELIRLIQRQLQYQISMQLIYQQAEPLFTEQMMNAIDRQVDRAIQRRINNEFGGVRARFEQHLQFLGLTEQDVRQQIKRAMIVAEFQRRKFEPFLQDPTRRELKDYYHAHVGEFTTEAKAEMFLIEIPLAAELGKPLEEASSQEVTEARNRARSQLQTARQKLTQGADFKAVARKYSKGVRAAVGGEWGEIKPGALQKRWAEPARVLFTLREGQISEIGETPESLFIVKCGQRTYDRRPSFQELQPDLVDRLKNEQFNELSVDYIKELRSEATISDVREFLIAVIAACPRPPGV